MKKLAYLMRRVAQGLLVLALIAVINFLLIRAAPGDPAAVMAGEAGAADEAFVAQLRERFGLDKPLPQQLATYLGHAARLDLGDSYRQQRPVMSLIGERLPATLLLTLTAFVVSLTLGVALGAWSSARAGTWLDSLVSTLSMLFYATPLFWLALMGVLLFSVKLEWLPGFGFETVGAGHAGLARAADIARHLVLPAATLALFYMAVYARMTRTAMLEVAQMDFIKTARARACRRAASSAATSCATHCCRSSRWPASRPAPWWAARC